MISKPAYNRHKASAKHRGIDFLFTFEEWVNVWKASGKADQRGREKGMYVMARLGDVGPYSVDNVEIIKFEDNCRDSRTNKPRSFFDLRTSLIGKGRGWTKVGNRFQVCVSRKYVGMYKTQEEAESAYRSAVDHLIREAALIQSGVTRSNGSVTESDGVRRK